MGRGRCDARTAYSLTIARGSAYGTRTAGPDHGAVNAPVAPLAAGSRLVKPRSELGLLVVGVLFMLASLALLAAPALVRVVDVVR